MAQAVQDLVGYARQIRQAVCENPTLKNVSLGLSALAAVGSLAGGLAAAAGVVAAGSVAAFAIPIVVASLSLGALAARIADDRQHND